MPALAKKLCRCQPSASLSVATSAPPPVFCIPISRARLVGGFIVLVVARAFAALVDGLVGVLRFDLAVIFASSTWARADPAPPTGASPDEAGRAREADLVRIARFPCGDTDAPFKREVQSFVAPARDHLSAWERGHHPKGDLS